MRDMAASVGRLRENLALVRRSSTNLTVRAPVDGQVSGLQAEVGELKTRGARLGQVDVLDEVMVRALVDEHYLPRVAPGQRATASVGGADYALVVRSVYPEVTDGRFEAEFVFDGAPARRPARPVVRLRLELGDPEQARLLARGGFYGDTGGQWAFVLAPDGRTAARRPVELGRQTPRHFEVLSGLDRGDRVVVSSYAAFGDADRCLVFRWGGEMLECGCATVLSYTLMKEFGGLVSYEGESPPASLDAYREETANCLRAAGLQPPPERSTDA